MRIRHVLDHSLPQHSGYAFRTVATLKERRERGWGTAQLTVPRCRESRVAIENAEKWRFDRMPSDRKPAVKANSVVDRCADGQRFSERASRSANSDRTGTQTAVRYTAADEPLVPAERIAVPA